ncbi:conserved hypothetical protein [Peptoclostridium litorale DSM 5388]|uniref:Purine nucleoside phosphorylase n=1 Tax=Peptoclostridium litorale DSM 5388 TaxID=1121324 RepID=A0A069RD92_PEPLI|nr:peptidoglycan editing factor PgeF [Peptoclostridium litorale]KDR95029.1 laccase domain-containing protein [Peptoclostridium litorale DSM 5388]SIN76219.1 conserved hypothetical protein [Peptoclostridium litorale DSM 5388]
MNYYEGRDFELKSGIRVFFSDSEVNMKNPHDISRFCKACSINEKRLTHVKQVHGTEVVKINEGAVKSICEGDAIVTDIEDTPIMIYVADCVPVAIIDDVKKVVGLAHCGWKGTYGRISQGLIDVMVDEYDSKIEDLKCIIGPSIGPCCYEVDEELAQRFNLEFTNCDSKFYIVDEGRHYLDLWKINRLILEEKGVPAINITDAVQCTCCTKGRFHSYRCDGKTSKRMALIAQI